MKTKKNTQNFANTILRTHVMATCIERSVRDTAAKNKTADGTEAYTDYYTATDVFYPTMTKLVFLS